MNKRLKLWIGCCLCLLGAPGLTGCSEQAPGEPGTEEGDPVSLRFSLYRAEGESKGRAFFGGVLSSVVEPIGAVLTILAAQLVIPALPYFLSFAAGAMLYVVVEELIPEMSQGKHSNIGTVFFAVGFSVMMTLDVALG